VPFTLTSWLITWLDILVVPVVASALNDRSKHTLRV
jgi:hypothetical protein